MKRLSKINILFAALLGISTVSTVAIAEVYTEFYEPMPRTARPLSGDSSLELVEFFWYGCPHCYVAEPILKRITDKLPKDVSFIRIPAANNPRWQVEATLYYLLIAKNILPKVHNLIFNGIHGPSRELRSAVGRSPDAYQKFLEPHTKIKPKEFNALYNSFGIKSRVRQAQQLALEYNVTSVPAIYVAGKYKIVGFQSSKEKEITETIIGLFERELEKK